MKKDAVLLMTLMWGMPDACMSSSVILCQCDFIWIILVPKPDNLEE